MEDALKLKQIKSMAFDAEIKSLTKSKQDKKLLRNENF